MVNPIGGNFSLYNLTSDIEKNAALNRGLIEAGAVELPFALMANNKDEKIERFMRACWFVGATFVAPVLIMPVLNKQVMKKMKIAKNDEEVDVVRVSKNYLNNSTKKMEEGFKITAENLEKNPKFKDATKHFKNVLERFGDKELLRQKLIKAHERIFMIDFLVASLFAVTNHWVSTYLTEKRTNRIGYVGEFNMADTTYTNKMAEKHHKNKKLKMAIAYLAALTSSIAVPKIISNAMSSPEDKLGSFMKFIKKHAGKFDYNNAKYASRAAYMAIWMLGDTPSYYLVCRDKHELKYRVLQNSMLFLMLFCGDHVLNNAIGRYCDHKLGTNIMNKEGYENASFFKKLLMSEHSLEQISNNAKANKLTKKIALGMYWGNFALITAVIGFGLPYILNKILREDVKKDIEKQNQLDKA